METLWSPWRMKYIQSNQNNDGCVFCTALQAQDDAENLIVFRGQLSFVILNRYPYCNGHIMVLPYKHVPQLKDLDAQTRAEMMELTNHATKVLEKVYQPQGFNIGANLGAAAGAGIEAHVHLHIVPRWKGDTNFMTAVGSTRVIPQALEESYQQIFHAW